MILTLALLALPQAAPVTCVLVEGVGADFARIVVSISVHSFHNDFLNLIVSMRRANGQDLFSLGIIAVVLNLRAVA